MKAQREGLLGLRRSSGETMHDAAETGWLPVFAEKCKGILPSLARVNHNRFSRVARDPHLFDEHVTLRLARRKIVMIVEADLAQRNDLWMSQESGEMFVGFAGRLPSVVRMHPDSGIERRITLRQTDAGFQVGRALARSDRHHVLDPGRQSALDHT